MPGAFKLDHMQQFKPIIFKSEVRFVLKSEGRFVLKIEVRFVLKSKVRFVLKSEVRLVFETQPTHLKSRLLRGCDKYGNICET